MCQEVTRAICHHEWLKKGWILFPMWCHLHEWEGTIPVHSHTIRLGAHWCTDDVGRVAQFLWLHLWSREEQGRTKPDVALPTLVDLTGNRKLRSCLKFAFFLSCPVLPCPTHTAPHCSLCTLAYTCIMLVNSVDVVQFYKCYSAMLVKLCLVCGCYYFNL